MAANSSAGTNSTFIVCGWWLVVGGLVGKKGMKEQQEKSTCWARHFLEQFGSFMYFFVFVVFCSCWVQARAAQRGLIADLLP
jgi:hypothetical protein